MKATLEPIFHRDSFTEMVEPELIAYLRETVFNPVFDLLENAGLRENERPEPEHPAVWAALLAGTLWYVDGVWTGEFNAAISRELRAMGAVSVVAGFALPTLQVPFVLRGGIALAAARSAGLHRQLLQALTEIEENLPSAPTGLDFSDTVDNVVEDLQTQLVRTVSRVTELPSPAPVQPGTKEGLTEEITSKTNLTIKDFSLETTQQLRARVQQNLENGGRTDRLAKVIEAEFGVAKRKARIIADAETSILVSRFRQDRYEALGSTEYVWSTSHDEKVRPTSPGGSNNHRQLDGRRFSWASPPVVDSATGRRRHPGEDYGPCRCVARPIVNF